MLGDVIDRLESTQDADPAIENDLSTVRYVRDRLAQHWRGRRSW
jgi:hypothetical protein